VGAHGRHLSFLHHFLQGLLQDFANQGFQQRLHLSSAEHWRLDQPRRKEKNITSVQQNRGSWLDVDNNNSDNNNDDDNHTFPVDKTQQNASNGDGTSEQHLNGNIQGTRKYWVSDDWLFVHS
jgi:hypothetical protein